MKTRIIIADDHRVFIDGMKALLKEASELEVVADAEDGISMIEQVEKHQPEIVLSDIQMPGKNGIEATQEIHKRFPNVKVIALTMMNESIYIKKMLEAGASGYVLKTADKEELLFVIKKVASGQKHIGAEVTSLLINDFPLKNSSHTKLLDSLTRREKEVLQLIAQGLTDKEIAEKVFLSPLTITTHRKNMLSKLGLKNKVELARFAIDNQLVA